MIKGCYVCTNGTLLSLEKTQYVTSFYFFSQLWISQKSNVGISYITLCSNVYSSLCQWAAAISMHKHFCDYLGLQVQSYMARTASETQMHHHMQSRRQWRWSNCYPQTTHHALLSLWFKVLVGLLKVDTQKLQALIAHGLCNKTVHSKICLKRYMLNLRCWVPSHSLHCSLIG